MREANKAALQILTGDHNQAYDREDSIRAAISWYAAEHNNIAAGDVEVPIYEENYFRKNCIIY